MNYKGFHVRHICKQREYGQGFRKGSRLFLTPLYFKGEDGCASLWIIELIQFFLSPLCKRGMMHRSDLRLLLQKVNDLSCIFYVAFHTQR